LSLAAVNLAEYNNCKNQLKQLTETKMKLDLRLIALKKERENLKDGGAKHEDSVMRENAEMQVTILLVTRAVSQNGEGLNQ
jgi:hypothetical protein